MELARAPTRWRRLLGIALGTLALGIAFVGIATRRDAERFDARTESLCLRSLHANVDRIIYTDVDSAIGPHASPSEVQSVEHVWQVLIAEESSPTCCPDCGAQFFINPDLGLWRTYPRPVGLAAVCFRAGRESHLGIDFEGNTVDLRTDEIPAWAVPAR